MGRRDYLGELEQTVLLAIVGLEGEAYGMSVRREIERRSGRNVAIGAVYQTVDRLLDKGHIRAVPGPDGARDGRARRFFRLTPAGETALRAAAELHHRMWAGIDLGRGTSR